MSREIHDCGRGNVLFIIPTASRDGKHVDLGGDVMCIACKAMVSREVAERTMLAMQRIVD